MERYNRIRQEFTALSEHFEGAMQGRDSFVVADVSLPEGYDPGTTDVRFVFPETYPAEPPETYVADRLTVDGRVPAALTGESDSDGWYRFRTRIRRDAWEPEYHTSVTALRHLDRDLLEAKQLME